MTDERFEVWVSVLLRAGVMAAAAIVLAGGIGFLIHHGGEVSNYHEFREETVQYTQVSKIFAEAFHFDWRAVIQLGLLVLIATPVARVALSMAAFALERDWIYVAITTLVLVILIYSLV